VRLANESGIDRNSWQYQKAAGRHADISLLAIAHELGMEYTEPTMRGAGECNKLAEVQYRHAQGCPWPCWLPERAAMRGYFELVRFCYERDCPWDGDTEDHALRCAAESDNVELVAWLLQQLDMAASAGVMSAAAAEGQTAMCQFLRSQQCPWDEESTNKAASGGHIDLLRWLVDNGCPWWERQLCLAAAYGGSIQVLTYLQQQRYASAPLLTDMLATAGAHSKLAAAKWLREQGAEWPVLSKRQSWDREVLEWAVAEGFTPPSN
jgi:hypothetical protein